MNLASPDQYNLPPRPLSSHFCRGTLWAATLMQKNASETAWHGRVVTTLSKALIITSAILSIPLMLIETVVSLALAAVGIAINKLFYQNRNEFLQKHTLKILSFSLHSVAVTFILALLGYRSFTGSASLNSHFPRALIDHALHLGSAAFVQLTYGAALDLGAGRDGSLARLRSLYLFKDSHPYLINDLLAQLERDLGTNLSSIRDRIVHLPQLQGYFGDEENADDLQFIQTLEWRRLLDEQLYRNNGIAIARRLLMVMETVTPIERGPVARRVELSERTPEESLYQNRLAQLFKDIFLMLHDEQLLWECLNRNGANGNELLKSMDASTYTPLVTATAFAEVTLAAEEIHCPAQFTGNLVAHNDRRAKIIEARDFIGGLNNEQKRALLRKILRGADEHAEGVVQEAFLKISRLAAPLIQGPLMTTTAFNLEALDNNQPFMQTRNLFQEAWNDAIATVEARQAAEEHG